MRGCEKRGKELVLCLGLGSVRMGLVSLICTGGSVSGRGRVGEGEGEGEGSCEWVRMEQRGGAC